MLQYGLHIKNEFKCKHTHSKQKCMVNKII